MPFTDSAIIREVFPPAPLTPGRPGVGGPRVQASVPPRTGLRELALEGVISLGHRTSIGLTSYPTEVGADRYDHTFDNPNQIRMVGAVSLLAENTSPLATWALIQQLKLSRKLVTISTNIGAYSSMILTVADTTEEVDTQDALWVELEFKELIVSGRSGPGGSFSVIPTGPAENRFNTNVHRGFVEALLAE